jgi:hypothetical protein
MRCCESIINSINPKNPVNKPIQTCKGLWILSFNLEERTSPPIITAEIRYHSNGVNIFKERINTRLIIAPAPTECSEIFHQKLITVTISERNEVAKINNFKKAGMGNLKIIYEVVQYRRVVIISGIFRSFLLVMVHELIIFL